jgi:hypothetical protein
MIKTFQTVHLHSMALNDAINGIHLPKAVANAFSSDQKYLCGVMKTNIPILPIHGTESCKLLQAIMMVNPGEPNEQNALELTWYIYGIDIFPTTPFYLRMNHKKWTRNHRVKDNIKTLRHSHSLLRHLNTTTLPEVTRGSGIDENGEQYMALSNQPGVETVQSEISFDGCGEEEAPVIVGTIAVDRASTLDVNVMRMRGMRNREKIREQRDGVCGPTATILQNAWGHRGMDIQHDNTCLMTAGRSKHN